MRALSSIKRWLGFRLRSTDDLRDRCRAFLENGPPPSMTDYIPESQTEVIIAHGAAGQSLDPELQEIGTIILIEASQLPKVEDDATREYLQRGRDLVEKVLSRESI